MTYHDDGRIGVQGADTLAQELADETALAYGLRTPVPTPEQADRDEARQAAYVAQRDDAGRSEMDKTTAVVNLEFTTSYAARFALGCGVDRATVADMLESLANAIRNPADVAENMSPILPDEF